jgi:VCBS repeat-containing protein
VAVGDSATLTEDAGATAISVLGNDTDIDGGPKTIASATQPGHGQVVVTGGGTGLTYQPSSNYCGSDGFAYTLNGGSTATVSITVSCVDDAPVATNDSASVTEDSTATAINVLANDTDVDSGSKSIQSASQPAHGDAAITGGGTGLTYGPDAGYCGSDSFNYTLNGGSTATVSVTVTCVDDPPDAIDDSATVGEDAPSTAISVLGNDTDIDGGPKTITSRTQPANGNVVITGGGSGLTYQPDSNYCNNPPGTSPDTFTYALNGGSTATVSVKVTCVDDPPAAGGDSATITEDAGATGINVLANDTDIDGGPKAVASVNATGAHGAMVITGGGTGLNYQPNANYCNNPPGTSPDTFTYTLNGGSTASVSVTVNCVDDPPLAQNDTVTVSGNSTAHAIDVLANDADVDGGPTSIGSVTQPSHGEVVITGGGTGLTYQPTAGYCGGDSFNYTLNGGASATVSLTVDCSQPPLAVNDSATVAQGSGPNPLDVLANDTDGDGGPMTIASVTQPGGGSVAITGAGSAISYQPHPGYCNGEPGTPLDNFSYTLNGNSSATVVVTVTCHGSGTQGAVADKPKPQAKKCKKRPGKPRARCKKKRKRRR